MWCSLSWTRNWDGISYLLLNHHEETQMVDMFLSSGCQNRLAQTKQFKITGLYSLNTGYQKSIFKASRGLGPLKGREGSVIFLEVSTAPSNPWWCTYATKSCLHPSLHLLSRWSFLVRTPDIGIRLLLISYNLVLTSLQRSWKALVQNRFPSQDFNISFWWYNSTQSSSNYTIPHIIDQKLRLRVAHS